MFLFEEMLRHLIAQSASIIEDKSNGVNKYGVQG